MRFNERTYTDVARPEDIFASPRKKQKLDNAQNIHERWKEAHQDVLQAYEDNNDGFPLMLSLYTGSSPAKSTMHSQPKGGLSEDEGEEDRHFFDPGPEVLWDIPGELVLAKDKRQGTVHWPAKVMRYIERLHFNDKEKYEVLYFDKTSKVISREMILTPNDDDFATCKVS